MSKLSIKLLAFLFVLFPSIALCDITDSKIITDANGCKVYNPDPQENESITWQGECVNGFADGPGRLEWIIGDVVKELYEGYMEKGYSQGVGTWLSDDGHRYDGEWSKGLQNGEGRYTFPSGTYYLGGLKDGKPHGKGTFFWKNGLIQRSGTYDNGEYVGD